MSEIQNMSHRHEALLRWMVANPHRKLGEAAQALGYSQAWVSCVVHSDIFQARLRDMQQEFDATALLSLRERLTGMAHMTLDRLETQLEFVNDPKLLLDASDKILNRLGYGTKAVSVQNNFTQYNTQNNTVSPKVLEEARRLRTQSLQLQEEIDRQELKEFPLPDVKAETIILAEVLEIETEELSAEGDNEAAK